MSQEPVQKQDPRWCRGSTGRIGEYGVVGAEQWDETHLDTRALESDDEDADEPYGANGRIKFSTKMLYGRQKELRQLRSEWHKMNNSIQEEESDGSVSSFPTVSLIAGYSGCGKSSLVEEFVRHVPEGSLFLSAKFAQQELCTSPFGAFGSLFDHLAEETRISLTKSQDTIMGAMGDDASILAKIFPGLNQFFLSDYGGSSVGSMSGSGGSGSGLLWQSGTDNGTSSYASHDCNSSLGDDSQSGHSRSYRGRRKKLSKERVMFVVQYFFQTLCNKERPLILFLDDLQWVDDQSLQLIQTLLTDNKLPYLFFIGAYRSNEVDEEHKMMKAIASIETKTKKTMPPCLALKDLSKEQVGQFICDSLRFDDPEDVKTLTDAIFTKTFGNALFTRQAMEQLVRKNALYYDNICFAWAWDLRQDQLEELISDDVVAMVRNKITCMPEEVQQVLQLASWVRSTFDAETLLEVMHPELAAIHSHSVVLEHHMPPPSEEDYQTKKIELTQLLYQAVEEALLVQSTSEEEEFTFAHDRIEEAARSFSMDDVSGREEEYRESFFAQIGKALYVRGCSVHGEDWMYFAAAKHLNNLSADHLPPFHLAGLNLHTAEISLELLAFPPAVEFCRVGIKSLPEDKDLVWGANYSLAVSLYTVGAEAEYGAENVEQAKTYCDELLKQKPKSIFDFLPAYKVHMDILGAKGDEGMQEAHKEAFYILEKMGYSFPKGKNMQKMVAWSALKTIKARYIPTEESIRDMPQVSDPTLIDSFDILLKAGQCAFMAGNLTLYALVCCETVKWMYKNGLTDGSAVAISSFANILMNNYGDFETAPKLAELAILIATRLKKKFNEPRALNTANMFVLGWVRPLRTRLEYHHRAREAGVISGNLEGAGASTLFASWNMMLSGVPLSELESFCRTRTPEAFKRETNTEAHATSATWQTALNLMGRSDSNTALIGEAMDESVEPFTKHPMLMMLIRMWKQWLWLFFGNWEEGAKNVLESGDVFAKRLGGILYGMEPVSRCMLLFAWARKKNDTKYKKAAQQVLKQLKEWVSKGCVNLEGPTKLLEAENYALSSSNKKKKARSAFENAISICQKAKFPHFAGLANERFAVYLLEIKEDKGAQKHISEAIDCYREWGATGKVEALQRSLLSLSMNSDTEQMD